MQARAHHHRWGWGRVRVFLRPGGEPSYAPAVLTFWGLADYEVNEILEGFRREDAVPLRRIEWVENP